MKYIIVLCSLHNRTKIKNEIKTMNYRFFINTAAELKKTHSISNKIDNLISIYINLRTFSLRIQ